MKVKYNVQSYSVEVMVAFISYKALLGISGEFRTLLLSHNKACFSDLV